MTSAETLEGRARSRGSAAPTWLALVATLAGLVLAFRLKAPCLTNPWIDRFEYRHFCYNDLQPLFGHRGISEGRLPYLEFVPFEYPVLTGAFMYLMGALLSGLVAASVVPSSSDSAYFVVSALFLAPFAVAVTLLLRPHVTRGRLMLWAVGTPTILYSFHNWELLAVAGAVWSLVELERRRFGLAGLGLGLGASAKLFPAFLVPGALLGRWAERDRRGAVRLLLAAAAAAAVVNVPVMVLSLRGWLSTWTFHADRYPDFGTVWYWIAHHGRRLLPPPGPWDPGPHSVYQDVVSVLSLILFAAGSLWYLRRGWGRRHGPDGYPVASVGLGILTLFLLVSKVHSPQYALWLVPLLVLLDVPLVLVLAYFVADIAVFISIFSWFTVLDAPAPAWKGLSELSVLARALALGGLAWWATRALRIRPEDPEASGRA